MESKWNKSATALLLAVLLLLAMACKGPDGDPTAMLFREVTPTSQIVLTSTPLGLPTPPPTSTPTFPPPTQTPRPTNTPVPTQTPSPVPTPSPVVVADEVAVDDQQRFLLNVPPTIALTPMEELVVIMCDPVFDRIIFRHDLTYEEYHEALIDFLALFESYTPPAVIEEFYRLQMEYHRALILHAASLEPETPVYPDDDWLERPGYPVELEAAFVEAASDLPPEFEAAWNEHGCGHTTEPVVISTPESESR